MWTILGRENAIGGFTDEELEALAGEELPGRKAVSPASCDPSGFVDLELDVPQPETPSEQ